MRELARPPAAGSARDHFSDADYKTKDYVMNMDRPWTYIYWTASFARAMRCASGGVCVSCLGSTVCIVYFRSHFATWSLTSMRFLR